MAVFKCKMCGGTLEINNESVATCEYCGTQQTLPKLENDKRINMYDRANHFRRNNEFDKAMGIYEQILNDDNTDAEAYWSLVLCRFGIEYVEDPATRKRMPTVNRAQFTAIFDDDNYKSALKYADESQKGIYEQEANAINEIQKGILAISSQEEPFDVFICYKETDNNGRRTPDSVLATELYHELINEGYKVFFSRITLEDKLGTAYEPYIFAALNSAKVMVVLGTKAEYFNAVWVKNEWSRYLSLIKQGQKKMLIPAYKDMDPYDLPEEFSHLQAQDMSKLGFMQDLVRGIKKIAQTDAPGTTVIKETVVSNASTNTSPLLRRAFMFLEDCDWASANEYCEKVLDLEPENSTAYVGKLMADLKVKTQDALKDYKEPFDKNSNYQKAVRFADDNLKSTLEGYIDFINTRNEKERFEGIYQNALRTMQNANYEQDFISASNIFNTIKEYKDAEELYNNCIENAEISRKNAIYNDAKPNPGIKNIGVLKNCIEKFKSIPGWRDSDAQIVEIQKRIEELEKLEKEARIAEENRRSRNKIVAASVVGITALIVVIIVLVNNVFIPNSKYNDAVTLMNEGKYSEAITAFEELDGYKDSNSKINEIKKICKYEMIKNANVGDYIKFGTYEQDNNTANGKEDIEWLILEKTDNRILVISKYALDCKPYNTTYTAVTWETCSLRKWLNSDFVQNNFDSEEKARIPLVQVSADENPSYSTNPGNATMDNVFLLSITEVNKYFDSDSARECEATAYAVENWAYVNSSNNNCKWWLRSPGSSRTYAASVFSNGGVDEYGFGVIDDDFAVRPAMWIDIS